MLLKLFYFLLIQFYYCKAQLQENAGKGTTQGLPYQVVSPGSGFYPGNAHNNVDCRSNWPDNRPPLKNQKALPLKDDELVSKSLKGESQSKPQNDQVLPYVPKKTLFVYDESAEADVKQNRNPTNQLFTPNYESEEVSRKGKNEPPRNFESAEIGRVVEECLTKKLKTAKKNRLPKQYGQLGSEELLNTRRSNSNDSNVVEDSLEDRSKSSNPSELDEALIDPAQGVGLRRLTNPNSNLLLMNNKKVCYACTSANNPNCWLPNRSTTVKYCRKGNDACVTKTYNSGNGLVVIRDCGNSCVNKEVGVNPEYKSCSICHSNLCNDSNGAFNLHINLHSLIFGLVLILFVKRAVLI